MHGYQSTFAHLLAGEGRVECCQKDNIHGMPFSGNTFMQVKKSLKQTNILQKVIQALLLVTKGRAH